MTLEDAILTAGLIAGALATAALWLTSWLEAERRRPDRWRPGA